MQGAWVREGTVRRLVSCRTTERRIGKNGGDGLKGDVSSGEPLFPQGCRKLPLFRPDESIVEYALVKEASSELDVKDAWFPSG